MCLLPSTITAEFATAVPAAWSNIPVKYLPPIISTDAAIPLVSVPVPTYNLSPLFPWVPAT